MLDKIKQSKSVIRQVLKENYFLTFIATSIILFVILYFLTLITTTNQSMEIFIMMNGLSYTISTFFLLAVISILFGIYVPLVVYSIRIKTKNRTKNAVGIGGFIVGLFSVGCPMCGAFLFGLFGAPLALFFLPFQGLELKVLSILLLSVSIYLISTSLISCKKAKKRK